MVALQDIDEDGDGLISEIEIHRFIEKNGAELDAEELQKNFRAADFDGDGKINLDGKSK